MNTCPCVHGLRTSVLMRVYIEPSLLIIIIATRVLMLPFLSHFLFLGSCSLHSIHLLLLLYSVMSSDAVCAKRLRTNPLPFISLPSHPFEYIHLSCCITYLHPLNRFSSLKNEATIYLFSSVQSPDWFVLPILPSSSVYYKRILLKILTENYFHYQFLS